MAFCSAQLLRKRNRGFVNQALFGSRKEEFRKKKGRCQIFLTQGGLGFFAHHAFAMM